MLGESIKPLHIIITIAGLFVGIIVAIIVSQLWTSANPITIDKIPSDAKLFVNDKEIGGDRTNLANGTYKIRVEKDGFETSEDTVVITDFNKTIVVALNAISDEAKQWAQEHSNEYLKQEGRAGAQYGAAGQKAVDQNPIIASLPINNYTYNVGYVLDQSDTSGQSIIITVDAYEGYRNAAVQSLFRIGFDPGDYTIRFDNYVNPFVITGEKNQ